MKKFLTITLSLAMLCTAFTTPIEAKSAHGHVHEEQVDAEIRPYALLCTNCDTGRILETRINSKWTRTGEVKRCVDGYGFGQDLRESRTATVTLRCNTCNVGYTYQTAPEHQWVCFGFN